MTTKDKFEQLLSLTDDRSQPNVNALWEIAKDLKAIKLNLKFFGYELAQKLADALPVREGLAPQRVGLASKACTQLDMESDWVAYWCAELKIPVAFHRKIWELAYVLQALRDQCVIREGARGLGFGCGEEPIASYLAGQGVVVTVTDLPPTDRHSAGWAETQQHTTHLDRAFHANLVSEEAFRRNVTLNYVDMNQIPDTLVDYDFCWSICAFEHLGSIDKGLAFVENSLATLRPGGVAVHTTEFNYLNDDETIDNWGTVLFQRQHFQAIHRRLTAKGHIVAPLNFDIGSKPMDKFIDLPPYLNDWSDTMRREWVEHLNHLKIMIDGFASTCFGLIIIKA